MKPLAPDVVRRTLDALAHGSFPCPFCGLEAVEKYAYEEGPRSERVDGPADLDDAAASEMTHRVYCPKEDRTFALVYRPRTGLPECAECATDFDVLASPPDRHFAPTSTFEASTECESCGSTCAPITYEAYAVVDLGLLGN